MLQALEILSGLWVCDLHAVNSESVSRDTTLFIGVCKEPLSKYDLFIKKISPKVVVVDSITSQFEKIIATIERELINGGKVVVFCETGRQRSPTIIIAYLIKYVGTSFEIAAAAIASKDYSANIFLDGCIYSEMLRNFETKIFQNKISDGFTTLN